MAKPGNTGIGRILRAAIYSSQGLASAWKHEAAFRQEVALMVVMSPLAIWLGRTVVERTVLIGVFLVVIIVELINSALEAAVDRHGDEHHELSGRAKDLGSAAVFVSLVLAFCVWAVVVFLRLSGQ
jgi:diacylglycerol kinase (ATP)